MKIGVITFPGSNCDHDMIYALKSFSTNEVINLWHKNTSIESCDLIVLPGGFSYGDYLRSGAIAQFSPIMKEVIKHANNGGLVLGVCNGFQILCETGLLPGTLLHNNNQKFICKNIFIKAQSSSAIISSSLDKNRAFKIPIAHAEGRYYANKKVLKELNDNDQIIFRYCNEDAQVNYDTNPNGALENIAGVCNKNKNVFGMMPHPERAVDEVLNNTDGRAIFESLLNLVSI